MIFDFVRSLSLIHIQMCIRDRCNRVPMQETFTLRMDTKLPFVEKSISLHEVPRSLCLFSFLHTLFFSSSLIFFNSLCKATKNRQLALVLALSLIHIQMCIRDRSIAVNLFFLQLAHQLFVNVILFSFTLLISSNNRG